MIQRRAVTFRLLTLNCFAVPFSAAPARLQTIAANAEADILCLQEIQLSRYLAVVRRALGDAHLAYQPGIHAPLGGLVTASRQPQIYDFRPFREGGRIGGPTIADRILRKGMLISRLTLDDLPLTIVNTHLVANYRGDWHSDNPYTRVQRSQVHDLISQLSTIDPSHAVVVAGDFNLPRGSALHGEIVERGRLIDVLAGDVRPTYRPVPWMPGKYAQPIDFVFVRPPNGGNVEADGRLCFESPAALQNGRRDYLSDHLGIDATITIRA